MDTALTIIGGSAVALSLGFWIANKKAQREHEAWCATASQTDGVVSRIGMRNHLSRNPPTDEDRITHVPVVRFRASDGAEYEFDGRDAPGEVGATVRVAYDPALPSNARVLQRHSRLGCVALLLVIGVVLLIAGLVQ